MTFHMAGFYESADNEGAFANIAALEDEKLFVQGDDLRVPSLNQVGFMVSGADHTVATSRNELQSPTLDRFARYPILPDNPAGTPSANLTVLDLAQAPLMLGVDEILRAQNNSNPSSASINYVLMGFTSGPLVPVSAQGSFATRAVITGTAVAGKWTSFTPKLDQELPPGDYAIIGMSARAAALYAARVILRTGEQWRPGCIGSTAATDRDRDMFRAGRLGSWGTFPFTQLPNIEVLCSAATTTGEIVLDLVKIS